VAFRIGNETYALPLEIVDEVVRSPGRLARVPHAPALLRGVMNLRGRVVPVIDPSVRFASRAGVAARTRNESTGRVVIVTIDGVQVGLAVDELRDMLSLPPEALRPAPELTPLGDRMVDRIALGAGDGSMILVLDPQAVLARAERDLLTDAERDLLTEAERDLLTDAERDLLTDAERDLPTDAERHLLTDAERDLLTDIARRAGNQASA
jgi:purine-binding chemotaxis protein CheW